MNETLETYLYVAQERAHLQQLIAELERETHLLEIQQRRQAMKETVRYEA